MLAARKQDDKNRETRDREAVAVDWFMARANDHNIPDSTISTSVSSVISEAALINCKMLGLV